jgi:hypothetical protein
MSDPPAAPRPSAPFFTGPMVEAYEELGDALQAEATRRYLAQAEQELRAIFLGFLRAMIELDAHVPTWRMGASPERCTCTALNPGPLPAA